MSTAPDEIRRLVRQFDEHRDAYRRGDYNETELRRDFLDPFFAALGWDVHNAQGYAEAYRDVIHEDSLRVEKTVKAPDYCFRIGGVRKFFVEAKRPSVDVRQDATDWQIDHLVYELYGLTDDEVKIVEKATEQ